MRCDWCAHSRWCGESGNLKCSKSLQPQRNDKNILFCPKYMREIGADDGRAMAYGADFGGAYMRAARDRSLS